MKEFAKIDVALREHPKILQAGDAAAWLFVSAILWSKQHDTDGFVPEHAIGRLTGLRNPSNAAVKCVDAGLLEIVEGGLRIHDYLDHQESSKDRRSKRHAASVAGRMGAAKRWGGEPPSPTANGRHGGPYSEPHGAPDGVAIAEEEEEKEVPTPLVRAKFRGKPVPASRLELAEQILADFNEQNRSKYGSLNGRGQPSENLKRILGALEEAVPQLTFEEAQAMTRWRLAHPFDGTRWQGKPHTGVVFGPGVVEANRESAKTQKLRTSSAGLGDALRAHEAAVQARQAARE